MAIKVDGSRRPRRTGARGDARQRDSARSRAIRFARRFGLAPSTR